MMRTMLNHSGRHVLSITGAVVLHGAIALWVMSPAPPVAFPQQQLVQVTLVSQAVFEQETASKPVEAVKEVAPETLPKEKSVVKAEPKPKPVRETAQKPVSRQQPEPVAQQQTHLTSGAQSSLATNTHTAITEPVAADYLQNPPPVYPRTAQRHKQQGTVMLAVRVSADGKPRQVEISRSSGHELLDIAALDAVKQWRFVPARRGTQSIEASVVVPVQFRIN